MVGPPPRLVSFKGSFQIFEEHPRPFHMRAPRGISASLLLNQASSGYAPRAFFFFLLSLPTAQRGL